VGNWEPLSIENLPAKNAAGASYEYRAREQAFVFAGDRKLERADGSDFLGDYGIVEETKDKTTTLKNTLGTNSLVVTKAWVDQKNKYELRPTSITLQVERTIDDGKTWSPFPGARGTVVLDGTIDPVEKTPWVATVEHLPEKAAAPGNPSYLYRAREVSFTTKDGTYQRTDNTIGAYKVAEGIPAKQGDVHANTITNTLAVGNLSVAKAWYDEGNRDGIRPSDLKIDIAAAVGDNPLALPGLASSVTLNAGNDWRADWKEVPLRTAAGSAITYSLTEAASSGYSPQYLIDAVLGEGVKTPNLALLEDGTKAVEFRNIHSPLSVDKTVTKTWDDGSNTYGIRPDSLKVSLYGTYTGNDGAPVKELVKTQVLTDAKADVWTHDFTGLPYYKPGLIGRVITYTVEEEAVEGYTLSYSDTDKLSMKNTLSPVPGMTLAKTDESGTPLAGATFTLTGRFAATPAGKTETKTLLSGGSQALVDDLIPGAEYTLLETVAPDGQKRMPGAVTIITNKSGVLSLGAATPSYVTLDAAKGLITVADPPIAVTIEKTAREDGRPLEGSYFDLTGLFVGETAERTVNGTGEALTSQIRGKLRASDRAAVQKATAVDMQGGAVQAAGVYVYTVKETAEPAGYQIEPKPIHFVVDDQGIISVLDDEGTITTVTDGGLTLQFSDPAISVGFVKTNTAGVQLSDAVLLLTGEFADGSTTKTITSQALQAVRLDAQLIAGKQYTLSETAPPQGYAALARPLIFAVDNLGKMTLVDNPEGAASLDATCTLLTIVDQAVSDVGVPGVPGWRFSTPSGSTPRGFSSPVSSRLSKTGDATNAILLPLIAVGAGVVVVAGAAQKRRQKARRRL
ncbi:MAG: Cna B-type domain-containing protein, partial [Raoultibacter sp.]